MESATTNQFLFPDFSWQAGEKRLHDSAQPPITLPDEYIIRQNGQKKTHPLQWHTTIHSEQTVKFERNCQCRKRDRNERLQNANEPKERIVDARFRKSRNEQFLLAAFLLGNKRLPFPVSHPTATPFTSAKRHLIRTVSFTFTAYHQL